MIKPWFPGEKWGHKGRFEKYSHEYWSNIRGIGIYHKYIHMWIKSGRFCNFLCTWLSRYFNFETVMLIWLALLLMWAMWPLCLLLIYSSKYLVCDTLTCTLCFYWHAEWQIHCIKLKKEAIFFKVFYFMELSWYPFTHISV